MKALYYDAFGKTPEVRLLPDPTPTPEGVVVAVGASGLCRSDWHGWMGHDADIHLPHVPGHELAGKIVATGSAVKSFMVGERITVPFVAGCGHCAVCRSGNPQVCPAQFQPGFTAWGSFAQYVAIDHADANLVHLPEAIDDAAAASLGCRFATSFRAIVDLARTRGGEWVAVHGCGGVGLSAIMIAAALGAQPIAIDISDTKLALARACGAVALINASQVSDVVGTVQEITHGGAHVSIDALGHPATCFNSVSNLRRRGRHVQVGLLLGEHATPPIPMARVIAYELAIHGSHGMQAWRYDALLAMIAAGQLAPGKLIGQRIGLEEAVPALVALDRATDAGITVITRF